MPLPASKLALAALLLLLPGCIVNADSHVHRSGRVVGPQTVAQIVPGKRKDFVVALLGEPTSTTPLAGGTEIWKWEFSEKRVRSGSLLFVFDSDETTERNGATYVEFENDVVLKAWQD